MEATCSAMDDVENNEVGRDDGCAIGSDLYGSHFIVDILPRRSFMRYLFIGRVW
jgi:hypothetical protein